MGLRLLTLSLALSLLLTPPLVGGLAWASPAAPSVPPPPAPIDVQRLPQSPSQAAVMAASGRLARQQPAAALQALAQVQGPAADLLRARALRQLGQLEAAGAALRAARALPVNFAPLLQLEAGLLAWAQEDGRATRAALLPLLQAQPASPWASQARVALTGALLQQAPAQLLQLLPELQRAVRADEPAGRSLLLAAQAEAQVALGDTAGAQATRLRRYLEEPVSTATPEAPPAGVVPTPLQYLERLERLVEAHRSERALAALATLPELDLPADLVCRRAFARGLAARKLRRYAEAEAQLTSVADHCADADLARRARYLAVKVISIRDGLRAVPVIEAFARTYPDHSMTDDVLFWAGDLYQRRGRNPEALAYYQRVEQVQPPGDQCAEARWRQAWMAYRASERVAARQGLERLLLTDGCVSDPFDRARANYWLGRLDEAEAAPERAMERYQRVIDAQALSFYAQAALGRQLGLPAGVRRGLDLARLRAPAAPLALPLCPDWLDAAPGFHLGLALLAAGLQADAALQFRALQAPRLAAMGQTHAASLGVAGDGPSLQGQAVGACGPAQARLLLALLLDASGAQHEAHWRLRTEFSEVLARLPSSAELPVWRAAYPLAYRDVIAPAEQAAGLEPYALQALAREESAFDAQVVSWAEAYGLTQLLLSSARGIGQQQRPPIVVASPEALLEPQLNARLGGALLGQLQGRFGNHLGLALAAYNAGEDVTRTWWRRQSGDDAMVYAEEVTIQETRGYVKRVLRTFGVYRWLYAGEAPLLPAPPLLPVMP